MKMSICKNKTVYKFEKVIKKIFLFLTNSNSIIQMNNGR